MVGDGGWRVVRVGRSGGGLGGRRPVGARLGCPVPPRGGFLLASRFGRRAERAADRPTGTDRRAFFDGFSDDRVMTVSCDVMECAAAAVC